MAHEHEGKQMLHKRPGQAKTFEHAKGPIGADVTQTIKDPQSLNQQGGTRQNKRAMDDED